MYWHSSVRTSPVPELSFLPAHNMVCTLIDKDYASLLLSQTFFGIVSAY